MKIKRNIFSSVICAVFTAITGYCCYDLLYRNVLYSNESLIMGGIVLFGTIVFIILSLLIRKKGYLQFFERGHYLMILLECFVVVAAEAALWIMNYSTDITWKVYLAVILLIIYVVARLTGGRLSGMTAVTLGWMFVNNDYLMNIDIEFFLLLIQFISAFCLYFLVTKYINRLVRSRVMICLIYLLYAAVFVLLMSMNVLIIVLFVFAVYNLFFAETKSSIGLSDMILDKTENLGNTKRSPFQSGSFYALLLLLFTVLLAGLYNIVVLEVFREESLFSQLAAPFTESLDTIFAGLITNTVLPTNILQGVNLELLPFGGEWIIAFMFLFAAVGGIFMIVKKYSYMKPLAMSFVIFSVAYYITDFFGGGAPQIIFFLLPVFTGYGLRNLLIADADIHDDLEEPSQEDEVFVAAKEEEEAGFQEWKISQGTEESPDIIDTAIEESDFKEPNIKETEMKEPEMEEPEMKEPEIKELEVEEPEIKELEVEGPEIKNEKLESGLTFDIEEESLDLSFTDERESSEEQESLYELDSSTGLHTENENTELEFAMEEEEQAPKVSLVDTNIEPELNLDEEADESAQAINDDYIDIKSTLGEDYNPDLSEKRKDMESELNLDRIKKDSDEDNQLNHLLDRLDLTQNIERMNASAQEDMAEVIESTSQSDDLENAIPSQDAIIVGENNDADRNDRPTNIHISEDKTNQNDTLEPDMIRKTETFNKKTGHGVRTYHRMIIK